LKPELTSFFPFCSNVTTPGQPAITKPAVDPQVVTSIDPAINEDSHVYIHCHFKNTEQGMLVRIWRTTFLIDHSSGSRSSLMHAENISLAPQWTMIPENSKYSCLLIFSALPKSCQQFDFKEEITQPGGFFVRNIARNETDVYHVNLL
jgi:hypothetical protein